MITANEARAKTNQSINDKIDKKLSEINKYIEDAISKGEFLIRKNGYLQPEVKQKLESLGYSVEISSQYNDYNYCIRWDD